MKRIVFLFALATLCACAHSPRNPTSSNDSLKYVCYTENASGSGMSLRILHEDAQPENYYRLELFNDETRPSGVWQVKRIPGGYEADNKQLFLQNTAQVATLRDGSKGVLMKLSVSAGNPVDMVCLHQ